jgi:putative salt-induced outer membrane protein YdiY
MKMMPVLIAISMLATAVVPAGAADSPPAAPDVVTLKDGSVIYGEVVEMSGGELRIKTAFGVGDIVKVKWANVSKLAINHQLPFHLKEGTVIVGTATEGPAGSIVVKAEPLQGALTIPMDSIASVNPLVQPPVVYNGSLQVGFSQTTGNSHLRNASMIGEFVGRSEQLRLSLLGRYVYGDNNEQLITRNSRGTIKLDFFVSKRFFWFASAYFEQDTFQDLKMRTALASGPGFQFIEKGDFNASWLKDMTLYVEAGASYFNEDFKLAQDKSTVRGRWSVKFNWPFFDDRVTFYHYQEGYPSMQNTKDFYLTMDNGMRFKLFDGFVSGIQVTTRYNNSPPPNTTDTDHLYLMTLGYSFDTSRKR